MTTMNSDERKERLKQIRARWATALPNVFADDINFLLSLLDSQAAEPVTYYNEDGSYNLVGKNIADHAATQMRDQCVAKVREMISEWKREYDPEEPWEVSEAYYVDAANEIITALSSLTLDVEQKEAK